MMSPYYHILLQELRNMGRTEEWFIKNGFRYNNLLMNKPRGGNYHWIDNHIVRGTRYNGQWTELTKKTVEIEVFDD